jgi:outer membrane protein assembly factor BamB
MNRGLFAYILLPVFILVSCDIEPEPTDPNLLAPNEKAYKAEILWNTEIFDGSTARPLIEGQYCYFHVSGVTGGDGSRMLKINLENGKVAWESPRFQSSFYICYPHKIGGHIYLPDNSGLIYVFNDSNGDLTATFSLGTDNAVQRDGPVAVSGKYLFWGKKQGGLLRLDCGTTDFTADPDEVRLITPELIWNKPWQPKIFTNMLSEDGKIYFFTRVSSEYASILTALDAETGEVIWEKNMPLFEGSYSSSLVLNGEKLHVIEKNNFCCDKSTGDRLYINYDETDPPRDSVFSGIKLHNNTFYYAAYSRSEHRSSIVMVNADTGRKQSLYPDIWETSSPQVYGKKLYVLHETGLRVYPIGDNDTKFIAVDRSFKGNEDSYTEIYKDKLVFVSNGFLTAIKCE